MKRKKAFGTMALPSYRRVIYALFISNGVAVLLYLLRAWESDSNRFWFLLWNLLLAWVPLVCAWFLSQRLRSSMWSSWKNIALTIVWLGFLPNSFYVVSDLIHLHQTGEVSILYDAVMFSMFIFNACVVGYMSMYIIHRELLKRISYRKAHAIMAAVILACGFAIYLGRSMRWNTWDILVNPVGILFDVSEKVINPAHDPQFIVTTATFSVMIGTIYLVIWELARALIADTRD